MFQNLSFLKSFPDSINLKSAWGIGPAKWNQGPSGPHSNLRERSARGPAPLSARRRHALSRLTHFSFPPPQHHPHVLNHCVEPKIHKKIEMPARRKSERIREQMIRGGKGSDSTGHHWHRVPWAHSTWGAGTPLSTPFFPPWQVGRLVSSPLLWWRNLQRRWLRPR